MMDTKPKTGAQGALPFRGDMPPVGAQVYPGDNREKASMPSPAATPARTYSTPSASV